MTLDEPLPEFQGHVTFQRWISQNDAFDIVQLQIIHLFDLQYNVPLTRGPSAIAESLVIAVVLFLF